MPFGNSINFLWTLRIALRSPLTSFIPVPQIGLSVGLGQMIGKTKEDPPFAYSRSFFKSHFAFLVLSMVSTPFPIGSPKTRAHSLECVRILIRCADVMAG